MVGGRNEGGVEGAGKDLVEIDLGQLVGDVSPVGLRHLIADPPFGKELYHVEQVLLLPPLRLRLAGSRGTRSRKSDGSAKASKKRKGLAEEADDRCVRQRPLHHCRRRRHGRRERGSTNPSSKARDEETSECYRVWI